MVGFVAVFLLAVLTGIVVYEILHKSGENIVDAEHEPVDDDDGDFSKGNHRRKALFIAINDYPEDYGKLYGCINDAQDLMKLLLWLISPELEPNLSGKTTKSGIAVLVELLRVNGFEVRTLFDSDATSDNYRRAVEWLYHDTQPGDLRLRAYSGHGTPTPDLSNAETDGLNETVALYDFDWDKPATWITDDEWWKPANNLPDGVNDITWFDCCHPDSGLRSIAHSKKTTRSRGIVAPAKVQKKYTKAYTSRNVQKFGRGRALGSGVIVFAGAQENQTSADASFTVDGKARRNGAFTRAMIETIQQNKTAMAIETLAGATEWLKQNGFEQVPQISAFDESRKIRTVFGL